MMSNKMKLKVKLVCILVCVAMFGNISASNAWISRSGLDGFGEPEGRLETYYESVKGPTDNLNSIDWTLGLLCYDSKFDIKLDNNPRDHRVELPNSKNTAKSNYTND